MKPLERQSAISWPKRFVIGSVLVTPNASALQPNQPKLQRFGAIQIVKVEEIRSIAQANATGTITDR